MSEIEKLLSELRNMKSTEQKKHIENNKETWSRIGSKDLTAAGFESESELNAWLEQNDYSNL
jgi:hypothetical protein